MNANGRDTKRAEDEGGSREISNSCSAKEQAEKSCPKKEKMAEGESITGALDGASEAQEAFYSTMRAAGRDDLVDDSEEPPVFDDVPAKLPRRISGLRESALSAQGKGHCSGLRPEWGRSGCVDAQIPRQKSWRFQLEFTLCFAH